MAHKLWAITVLNKKTEVLQREQQKKNNSIWNQPLSARAPTANVSRPL